jgi:hypothetical protein
MIKLLRFTLLGLALSLGSAAWGIQSQQSSGSGDSGNSAQSQSQSSESNQQQSGRGRMRRGAQQRKNMAELARKLNLTDDQKAQFQKIRQNSMQQSKSIRADSSLSDAQKKQKMLDLRKQSHQQMFSILTSDQKQRLKQIREEHKKQTQTSEGSGQQGSAQRSSAQKSSAKKSSMDDVDDDPFAGMTSDDDGGQV